MPKLVKDQHVPEPMTDRRLRVAAHMREVELLAEIARSLMENPQKFDDRDGFIERHTRQLEAVEECYKEVQHDLRELRDSIDALYMIVLESQVEEVKEATWWQGLIGWLRSFWPMRAGMSITAPIRGEKQTTG
jgi:hypothetical protein